jgi:hypothetical protein
VPRWVCSVLAVVVVAHTVAATIAAAAAAASVVFLSPSILTYFNLNPDLDPNANSDLDPNPIPNKRDTSHSMC